MRRMNSMFDGHQGASARTPRMYLSMVSLHRGVVPRQWQAHQRESTSMSERSPRSSSIARRASTERVERQNAGVIVDLQRADAWRLIYDASEAFKADSASDRLHQRMDAKAETKVEHDRSVFDQEIGVAGTAIDDDGRSPARHGMPTMQSSTPSLEGEIVRRPLLGSSAAISASCLARRCAASAGVRRMKRTLSPGCKLPHLPQLCLHDGGGTDEAAKRRPVGPEDHRHVAGEVDGADGVSVVVDVARMQSGFAAVAASPDWASGRSGGCRSGWSCSELPNPPRRTLSMYSGAKKVRRAVRAVEHADLPIAG